MNFKNNMNFIISLLISTSVITSQIYAASYTEEDNNEWKNFKLKFQKFYENEIENVYRMKIFLNNKRKIDQHNKFFEQGAVSFKLGMNQFGDMFHREYTKWLSEQSAFLHNTTDENVPFADLNAKSAPYAVDWRKKGAVTPVKYQGSSCASSWAFSATGSLEGMHFIKTGRLIALSEQNLMDCSYQYGNYGCRGGTMVGAFQYIRDNKGVDVAQYYPYEAKENYCRFNPKYVGASLRGINSLRVADENALLQAVGTQGPVSVAIDASLHSFQYYTGGLYKDLNCGPHNLNHAVLVVGYNYTVNKEPYWLVKNSWGTQWGENGYIRMARNVNLCGIANKAVYPTAVSSLQT